MSKIRLGVNIDHVATVRNARGENYPSPLRAALFAQKSGADSVTIHLREDKIIMKAIAKILTELVTTGADDGSKWLGASYVLSALTLVSSEAADALPWLYQSVSHQ